MNTFFAAVLQRGEKWLAPQKNITDFFKNLKGFKKVNYGLNYN